MNKLKALYNQITQREKVLLALFLWVMVLIWGSWMSGRISRLLDNIQATKASLAHQQIWLDNEASIEARLLESRNILDPKKTYARSQFIAKVDGIARSTGAAYDITNPTTALGDVFNEHSLTVQFKDAPMKALLAFETAINKEGAYMSIIEVKLNPNRRDPILLNAQFDVIALELKNIDNVPRTKN